MFLTKMSNILIFLSLTLFQCIICKYSLYCKCYKTRRWEIDEKKIAHTGLILAIGTSMLGHESIVKAAESNQQTTNEVDSSNVSSDTDTQERQNSSNNINENHQSDTQDSTELGKIIIIKIAVKAIHHQITRMMLMKIVIILCIKVTHLIIVTQAVILI